jgi:hypothetical protein
VSREQGAGVVSKGAGGRGTRRMFGELNPNENYTVFALIKLIYIFEYY